jgi:hypothetical protein
VLATFGRGFYILDDYSALRELTPAALAEEGRLFSLRDAPLFGQTGQSPAGSAGIGPMAGNWTAPNPPFGAVFTYNLKQDLPAGTRLVLTITDDTGKQVRRLELEKTAGLRRIAWNLRGEPVVPAGADGRGAAAGRGAGDPGGQGAAGRGGVGGFAFGGRGQQPPLVQPGRYRATLGRMVGETITPIGAPQTFNVVRLDQ